MSTAVLAACHSAAPRVVVEVAAAWPGSSPEVVASSVATPLERALGNVPHLLAMTSVSREGGAVVRIEIEGKRDAVLADTRRAIETTAKLLPASLPAPPLISTPATTVGRFLAPAAKAEEAAMRLERMRGTMRVETCGLAERREEILVDAAKLAATGLTLADVRTAVASANVNAPAGQIDGARRDYALATGDAQGITGALVLAYRNGAPVRLLDVAQVRDTLAPMDCALVPRGMVELDVHASPDVAADLRGAARGLGLGVVSERRELHGELDPMLTPEAGLARIADAVGSDAVAELRGSELVVRGASPTVVARLRRTAGVVTLGERTATVHISGADPRTVAGAAHAIAERLRAADQLVATHGLATMTSLHLDVDRDAAARLGITSAQIDDTLAASYGAVVSTVFTQTEQFRVVLRADDPAQLAVRGTDNALVPLSSIVRITQTVAPLEILHRGQFPDVDLDVDGDPRGAIGSVPAGVRVEIEDAR